MQAAKKYGIPLDESRNDIVRQYARALHVREEIAMLLPESFLPDVILHPPKKKQRISGADGNNTAQSIRAGAGDAAVPSTQSTSQRGSSGTAAAREVLLEDVVLVPAGNICQLQLFCPITSTRIRNPVKGQSCMHLDCFDR
jgi:hypothetical protein